MRERKSQINLKSFISPVTWIFRIICGGVFIFSGMVKGIDPWGTIYKFQDYLGAMGLHFEDSLIVAGAFSLCALEFLLGIFLLFGCFRKSAPIVTALFMGVMLPLTLWIAIADPVSDCGCFGDAVIISNWATFWKNVILSLMIIWLLIFNRRVHWGVTPALQWLVFIAAVTLILIIEIAGYNSQPFIDFRDYKTGSVLFPDSSAGSSDADDDSIIFIYEKDGQRQEFTVDNIPDEDEGWVFIERKENNIGVKTNQAPDSENNLLIWSPDDESDLTSEVGESADNLLIITFPSIKDVSIASSWKINSLYTWATRNGINVIGLASGSKEEIAEWSDLSMAEYPVYCAEDTVIKEIVRGNPGVIYVKDGVIQWKSSLKGIDIDDFLSPDTESNIKYLRQDDNSLRNLIMIFAAVMGCLIMLSFTPALRNLLFNK